MKKFKKNNKRNTMLIIAAVVVVGLVVSTNLIKSHANFSASKSFNIIQGKIPNKNNGDVAFVLLSDGKSVSDIPNKDEYSFYEGTCNNDEQ